MKSAKFKKIIADSQVIIIILTLLFGCSNSHTRENEIKRIVFATGGCYGQCPVQVIDIDNALTVKYHGIKYTERMGFLWAR
jgi:hypothetical protein